MRIPRTERPGFTLVEMLVVIIIIMILATLTVAIAPKISGEQKLSKGADQVQGVLLLAKSRAKRDHIPTGVRLIPDPNNPLHVRELQYVQQPDDFVGGSVELVTVGTPPNIRIFVRGTGIDFTGGFNNPLVYPVQIGDHVEIKGGGMVHRIKSPPLTLPGQYTQVEVEPILPPPHYVHPTEDYRIIRQPRVLIGETPMLLAQDIIIDTNSNLVHGNALPSIPGAPIDIMFAPSGSLVNAPGISSFVALWVRDVTADPYLGLPHFGGDPIIVCVHKRAGFIAAHPVDKTDYGPPVPYQPYKFANDGKSSGL